MSYGGLPKDYKGWPDVKKEKTKKDKLKKVNSKKEKPVFHNKSEAGKGDVQRIGITLEEWGDKWEKIFKPKGRDFFEDTGSNENHER